MKKVSVGDYVIAHKQEEEKNLYYLLKVKSFTEAGVSGMYEREPHIHKKSIEVTNEQIALNLGPKPLPGKVYGFDTSALYVGTKEHDIFGSVYFYERTPKEKREALFASMSRVHKKVAKLGIQLDKLPVLHECHPQKGKTAGYYMHSKDLEKHSSRIHYCVTNCPIDSFDYLVAHENAHAIDYLLIQPSQELRSAWIRTYNGTIATRVIPKTDNAFLLKSLISGGHETVKAWYSGIDDAEMKENAKYALNYLRRVRGVGMHEIDTLMATGDSESIRSIWVKTDTDVRNPKPLVSEYATKNVNELVAESFAFYLTGTTLPDGITELVEKSLRYARNAFKQYA